MDGRGWHGRGGRRAVGRRRGWRWLRRGGGGRTWLVQGGREEKEAESLPRAVVLALSGRPTSRPPRSRRIAPVSPLPPHPLPFGPSLRRVAPLEPPPSSTLLSPLFLAVCFDFASRFSLPLFLSFRRRSTKQDLFVMFFCFDLSVLLDREDGEGEEGKLAQILNFFNFFSIRIYFDLGLLLGFSLKKGIVSLNFFLIFFYFNFFILVLSRSRSKENWSQTST